MYTSDIHSVTQFGFQTYKGCFPYSNRLNEIILQSVRENTPSINITCISSFHREIQIIDLKNYIVERTSVLDDFVDTKQRYYNLIGKVDHHWVTIVPNIEYPEFVVEFIKNQRIVRYFRIEGAMAVTQDGVIIIYNDNNCEILFTVNEIIKIGKSELIRKMNIRYIPFDMKFYYSPSDKDIVTFTQTNILTDLESNNLFIYNSKQNKVFLNTIKIFESFSPEKRKKILFETIQPELISRSHDPYRYFNWCLDEEDKLRIEKIFIT